MSNPTSLRELAGRESGRASKTVIGTLLAEHPDRAEEINDLLTGEPRLGARAVAKVLSETFDVHVSLGMVQRWRGNR